MEASMFYLARRAFSFLLFLSICVCRTDVSRSETFSITPVALQGQPAPGTGGTFSEFLSSSVNDSGDVVFRALINGGNTRQGVFLFSGGSISPVVLEGQVAPGTGGLRFFNFNNSIAINNAGDVAFFAALSGAPIGDPTGQGIFLFSKGVISTTVLNSQILAETNTQIGGLEGGLSLNDRGSVSFSNGVKIFLYSFGNISLIASPEGTQFSSFYAPSLNNRGEIAFVSGIHSGFAGTVSAGISLYSQGKPTAIVSTGTSFTTPRMNDSGLVALRGCVSSICGVHLYKDGALSLVASVGQTAFDEFNFSDFNTPVSLNNSGSVGFRAGLQTANFGMGEAILLYDGTRFIKVATRGLVESGDVPGTGGGRFTSFSALSPGGSPWLNNRGTVAFIAFVGGGNTNGGVFLATPQRPRRRP